MDLLEAHVSLFLFRFGNHKGFVGNIFSAFLCVLGFSEDKPIMVCFFFSVILFVSFCFLLALFFVC